MNIAAAVALACAAVFSAAAQDNALDAEISKISGPVFVVPAGSKESFPARGGQTILFGDAVRTGPGGLAHVALGGGGAVLVRENTTFALKGSPRRALLDFTRGEFLIGLRRRLASGESFRVRTPAAVASVRGTLFWGRVGEDKSSVFAGFGHEIAVAAKGKTVVLRAGQTVRVARGQAPPEPKPHDIPVGYLQGFSVDGSIQGLEGLVALPGK